MTPSRLITALTLGFILSGCDTQQDAEVATPAAPASGQPAQKDASPSIEFEKYTLDNGLDVILHI
ncbi:MAG: hypothetical protein ABGY96_20535, partial [bacterium]